MTKLPGVVGTLRFFASGLFGVLAPLNPNPGARLRLSAGLPFLDPGDSVFKLGTEAGAGGFGTDTGTKAGATGCWIMETGSGCGVIGLAGSSGLGAGADVDIRMRSGLSEGVEFEEATATSQF